MVLNIFYNVQILFSQVCKKTLKSDYKFSLLHLQKTPSLIPGIMQYHCAPPSLHYHMVCACPRFLWIMDSHWQPGTRKNRIYTSNISNGCLLGLHWVLGVPDTSYNNSIGTGPLLPNISWRNSAHLLQNFL